MPTIIVWFQNDLRLLDHPALYHAAQDGEVLPVFILSSEYQSLPPHRLWWLQQSLRTLQKQIKAIGGRLIIKEGTTPETLYELAHTIQAQAIYYHVRYEPDAQTQQDELHHLFSQSRITLRGFEANLLFPPTSIRNKKNEPFKIFTPFWKALRSIPVPKPLPKPDSIQWSNETITNDMPKINTDDIDLHKYWTPGEPMAIKQWQNFLHHGLSDYLTYRTMPAIDVTSKLSPHLAWGEISPRFLWHDAQETVEASGNINHDSVEAFLRQLAWRDFAYHQLVEYPHITTQPLQSKYQAFPYQKIQPQLFTDWKQGKTGYPLVDAGMRQLAETGWMHNRVRMVAGSFLVKHLLFHWLEGVYWFQENSIDHDIALNTLGWQWVAGTGFDATPYFRIFNPIRQAERFDPDATYIKKWVPELSQLPAKYTYAPQQAPDDVLQQANITLGDDYPYPMVDHKEARERALTAYQFMKDESLS
ncbi:deoxyribodipyrimidine photolyase [Gracilibacillus halophilus YIM-C55.5]|uniref:Deoxyribodipyrimidine photolyase n=1 Tax=Gracilibacillus halophilus YIM-C55.5 TaxID=1308866 RepID=N4WV01_9BACI|nr:deoxyribodipyrimidine photo-lyase [Gracilibacillus halophilus]ENH98175.1 deoxyribodipyrimidine photolyase [Gracilibacillus halophilus YIM-C55.5]